MTHAPLGTLEVVHRFEGPMPTGVSVSHTGRIFVNFPQWGDDPPATVVELRDGREVPYPDQKWNSPRAQDDAEAFVSVQSVIVDAADRLWVLDTGAPYFQPTQPGGPKLVRVDLTTDAVVQVITFDPAVALPTTYLNDVRFDLRRGEAGLAYITDSSDQGPNGIIVVDLGSGAAWRKLHDHPSTKAEPPDRYRPLVEGRPLLQHPPGGPPRPITIGADGIAISADGERLYYCPLISRRWYSVPTDALADRDGPEPEVRDEGDRGGASDGLETDDAGNLYTTNWEHDAILRRRSDGEYETVVHDPRLLWPDTMSVATDGYLYVTANQAHRLPVFQGAGEDLRRRPYHLFRTPIGAGPVLLRPEV